MYCVASGKVESLDRELNKKGECVSWTWDSEVETEQRVVCCGIIILYLVAKELEKSRHLDWMVLICIPMSIFEIQAVTFLHV